MSSNSKQTGRIRVRKLAKQGKNRKRDIRSSVRKAAAAKVDVL